MKQIEIIGKKFMVLDLDEVDDYSNPKAYIHLTNGDWDWFVIAGDYDERLDDIYCFGLVNGFDKELGFFALKDVFNNGAVLVEDFVPVGVYDIFPDFDLRI